MQVMDAELDRRWHNGTELGFAWRLIPDAELQAQYNASGENFGQREFVIRLMKAEMADRLSRDEFLAIGVAVAPTPSAELRIIPNISSQMPIQLIGTIRLSVHMVTSTKMCALSECNLYMKLAVASRRLRWEMLLRNSARQRHA